MSNGRSGGFGIHTRSLIAALKQLDADAAVGLHIQEPVTAAKMLAVAEYTALVSILVEEQYCAWFIVRLPDFWVTVKEESPLFRGLVDVIHRYSKDRLAPPQILKRPIEHCYWVAAGKLLAGEYPGAVERGAALEKIKAFADASVAAFIDLTEERDGLQPYAEFVEPAVYQRFPIRDVSIPVTAASTTATLDAIDAHIAEGRTVYVHCWGGVGRTGVIVGCWLARHGMPGHAALERLAELWKQCPKSARRDSPETSAQRNYITTWREEG